MTTWHGLYFEPTAGAGGASFLKQYHIHRSAIKLELSELRTAFSHLDILTVSWVAHWHSDWPVPSSEQLQSLLDFCGDAYETGWKIQPYICHPHIVPTSADSNSVSGHAIGEIVNGYRLYWSIPSEENPLVSSVQWYTATIDKISLSPAVSRILLGGHHRVPFATEFGGLLLPRWYRQTAEYIAAIGQYLKGQSYNVPIVCSLLPALGQTGDNIYVPLRYWYNMCKDYWPGGADITVKRDINVSYLASQLSGVKFSVSDLGIQLATDLGSACRSLALHGGAATGNGLSWWGWSLPAIRAHSGGTLTGALVDLINSLAAAGKIGGG